MSSCQRPPTSRTMSETGIRLKQLKKINEEYGGLTADELAEAMILEEKIYTREARQ